LDRTATTHVIFEPLDFLARLAALVPSPGVNLTRYHGAFAPNHRHSAQIAPKWRGPGEAKASGHRLRLIPSDLNVRRRSAADSGSAWGIVRTFEMPDLLSCHSATPIEDSHRNRSNCADNRSQCGRKKHLLRKWHDLIASIQSEVVE
jgi:hypothetical protein